MENFSQICLIGEELASIVEILLGNQISFEYSRKVDSLSYNIVKISSAEEYVRYAGLVDCMVCAKEDKAGLPRDGKVLDIDKFASFVSDWLAKRVKRGENSFLLEKLVKKELIELGVPSTYTGFAYLLNALDIRVPLPQHNEIMRRSMERDVFRLMTRCWNKNKTFRLSLNAYLQRQNLKINSKNILKCLKLYVDETI